MNTTVQRTLSGIVFLVIMVAGLLLHPVAFAILFFLMTAGMLHEFFSMNMGDKYKGLRRMAISVGLLWFASAFLSFYIGLNGILMLCIDALLLLAFMAVSVLDKDHENFKLTAFLYAGLLYIAIPLSLLIYINPSKEYVYYGVGVLEGALLLFAFVLNIVQSRQIAKEEKQKKAEAEAMKASEAAEMPAAEPAAEAAAEPAADAEQSAETEE